MCMLRKPTVAMKNKKTKTKLKVNECKRIYKIRKYLLIKGINQ